MKKFYILFLLTSFSYLTAQTPEIEWSKNFGGSGDEQAARSVQQTSDGGFIVLGPSNSQDGDVSGNHGNFDFWVVKISPQGELEWEKSYGGSDYDWANHIINTTDGGYILAGFTDSNDGDVSENKGESDCWIVKLNAEGEIEWEKTYGGSLPDIASSIKSTPDGGYIFSGSTQSVDGDVTNEGNDNGFDFWVVKISDLGVIEWEKTFGGTQNDISREIQLTPDGGYILSGETASNDGDLNENQGMRDGWVLKLNALGEIQWQKTIGGSQHDRAEFIKPISNENYIVCGYTNSDDGDIAENKGSDDVLIFKLNDSGEVLWLKTYGGSGFDKATSLIQTQEDGFILIGETDSTDGDVSDIQGQTDIWMIKVSADGNLEWQKTIGGSGMDDWALSIIQSSDNGMVLTGRSNSTDGDLEENNGGTDFWIVKFEGELVNTNETNLSEILLFPNPVSNMIHFSEPIWELNIFDLTGNLILNQNSKMTSFNLSSIPSGVYILKGTTENNKQFSNRIIKK